MGFDPISYIRAKKAMTWTDVRAKLESEGAKNVQYDSDLDGKIEADVKGYAIKYDSDLDAVVDLAGTVLPSLVPRVSPFTPLAKLKLYNASYSVANGTPGSAGVEVVNVTGTGYLLGWWLFTEAGSDISGGLGDIGPEITINGEYSIPWMLEGYGLGYPETQRPSIEAVTHDWWGSGNDVLAQPGPRDTSWVKFRYWSPATGVYDIIAQLWLPHGFTKSLKVVIKDYASLTRKARFGVIYGLFQEEPSEIYRLYAVGHNNCVEAGFITAGSETTIVDFTGEGFLWSLGYMNNGTDAEAKRVGFKVYVDGEASPSLDIMHGGYAWDEVPVGIEPAWAGYHSIVGSEVLSMNRQDNTNYVYAGYIVAPTWFKNRLRVDWVHRGATDLTEAHWNAIWYERVKL